MTIAQRLRDVQERIAQAATASGRDPEGVTLVLVTKRQPLARIREAYEAGARVFGENRLTEAEERIEAFGKPASWHMIGHLQTRAAKHMRAKFDLIHSVDSMKTLKAINDLQTEEAPAQPVLVQVNVSGEASKFGLQPGKLESFLEAALELPNTHVSGLMTMAPAGATEHELHHVFGGLRELRDKTQAACGSEIDLGILSMGMSNDYEIAIAEGATHVRVGTAILGPREG